MRSGEAGGDASDAPLDLRGRLERGDVTVGSWLQLADESLCEMMATSGFDWLCVDREHTTISTSEMGRLIRVASLAGCPALVRLPDSSPAEAKKALDAGAVGVIVPMVCSVDDAERAVSASHYPPRGHRGVGLARAQRYGVGFDEYRTQVAPRTLVVVQIEHVDAVDRLEDILAVDGVDGFFVGPYDLSASLGAPGDFEHPAFLDALAHIDKVRRGSDKLAGRHVVEPDFDRLEAVCADGYRFVAFASDMLLFSHTLASVSERLANRRSN